MPTHDIPAEQQVAFLQKHIVRFKLDVFEELKESLGKQGHGYYLKRYLQRGNKRVNDMAKGIVVSNHVELCRNVRPDVRPCN